MALNYVFVGLFLIGFIIAVLRTVGYLLRHQMQDWFNITMTKADLFVFKDIVDSTFSMAETSITIVLTLIGVMTFWLGIMKVGEDGGAVQRLSKLVSPLFQKLFPELPKNHPAMTSMLMNFSANMLGLDNAATPFGLKAMDELQTANKEKDTASNAMIMFLVLNTSGLTLIPISVMALRAESASPSEVFLPILFATFFATLGGLITVSIYQKINLFNKTVLAYLGSLTALIIGLLYYFSSIPQEQVEMISMVAGNSLLAFAIVAFIFLAFKNKINVYESFIDGAKEGFSIGVKIIPYLVGILIAIGVFRASGAFTLMMEAVRLLAELFLQDTRFVDSLPTAFMKPFSGGGARAMMIESIDTFGVDSFQARLSAVFQGSTETTFYTLAVYYGAVNIKKTRYTVSAGLTADFIGIVAAIIIAYIFFG